MEVKITRDEADAAPDIIYTSAGNRNFGARAKYFMSLGPEYVAKALEVVNHVLQFFQHSLFTPLVRLIREGDTCLKNPTWYDPLGNELETGIYTATAHFIVPRRSKLDGIYFTPDYISDLADYMSSPREPSLVDTLLSDAQAAWCEKNLRRAVLELAICAELMVKRTFFAKASPAGAAFDYLEDKARVSVRVLELLDVIAEEAFARNYRKENIDGYRSIDHLFRCRNKIAHRGELLFRDDKGDRVEADSKTVEIWWLAVAELKNWLETLP